LWVIDGHELAGRGTPRDFAEDEDQGQSLPGRWVNSHELLAGDIIIGRDGRRHRILGISQRFEGSFPVSNLTIGEFHNYAVGPCSILVHNHAVCAAGQDLLQQLFDQGKLKGKEIETVLRQGNFTNSDDVLEAITKGFDTSKALRNSDKIQNHHLISNPVVEALEDIGINGAALRNRLDLQYNSAPGKHIGYEEWHRAVDAEIVKFIQDNKKLNERELLRFIHDLYQRPDLVEIIPGVNLSQYF